MQSATRDPPDPQRSPFLQSAFMPDAGNQSFASPPAATSPPIPIPNPSGQYQYTPPSYSGSFGSNPDSNWGEKELEDPNDPFAYQDEYNPNDFDGPDASPSSFQFFDSDHLQPGLLASLQVQNEADPQYPIHLSLTPADSGQKQDYSGRPGDAPSPASSSGSGNDDRRSRASSISSVHTGHHSPAMPAFQTLSFDPDLDAKQNFDVSAQAPQFSHTGPSPPSSPPIKPQSPPALVIPSDGSSSAPPGLFASLQPQPNAGGLLPGPASININIVPSTPISGGGANTVAVPFQHVLHNLNQNPHNQTPLRGSAGGAADPGRMGQDQPPFAHASHSHSSPSPHIPVLPLPRQDHQSMEVDSQVWTVPRTQVPSYPPSRSTTPSHFPQASERMVAQSLHSSPTITPSYPRAADPTLGLVNLNLGAVPTYAPNGASSLLYPQPARSRSRSDTSLHPPSWAANSSNAAMVGSSGLNGMGLGLNVNGPSGALNFQSTVDPSDVLTRETTPLYSVASDPMRPSFRPGYLDDSDVLLSDMSLRRSRSQDGRPGHQRGAHSADFSRNMYLPAEPDVWRPITTPDGSLAPSDPREPMAHGSPRRRRGASPGHERGASLSSSTRPSPYPSPSASPLMTHDGLPYVQDLGGPGGLVSRPHVTTPATRSASGNRRKSEAAFKCPVPGCGSTFTRHFNLKGHLRSHNEERPFKCKWPGCEKGFARQHDCKRHEALHLNIRPYTCDGCGKTFARMDALNRHLRSEGGVECARNRPDDDPSALEADGNGDDDAWQGPAGRGGLVL